MYTLPDIWVVADFSDRISISHCTSDFLEFGCLNIVEVSAINSKVSHIARHTSQQSEPTALNHATTSTGRAVDLHHYIKTGGAIQTSPLVYTMDARKKLAVQVACAMICSERPSKKKKKRMWMHQWIARRAQRGLYLLQGELEVRRNI